jgi:ubiquinone/menaquinone biosynthesis C-methylase UbiE
MPAATSAQIDAEAVRVQAAYARRHEGGRYSFFDAAHLLAVQERERLLMDLLSQHGIRSLEGVRVLDVGCGTGGWLREWLKWGTRPTDITGVDVLPDRIVRARELSPEGVTFIAGNAAQLGLPPGSFDIVTQSMLMTSVLDSDVRREIARSMRALLKPGGIIVWYDYHVDNPRNPDVRRVTRREIVSLFPSCRIDLRRTTLAAPIARVVAPRSRWLYSGLRMMPWLRTHYLGIIRPVGSPDLNRS